MNSFKDIAYQILREVGESLHDRRLRNSAAGKRSWAKVGNYENQIDQLVYKPYGLPLEARQRTGKRAGSAEGIEIR